MPPTNPPRGAYPAHHRAGRCAYVLVGPTAAGKTEVAQWIAQRDGMGILSADSMLIYRGMDIGTAKPSPAARGEVEYRGMDLADPDEAFSAGRWLEAARAAIAEAGRDGRIRIVVGGTGLYVKALLLGLDEAPPPEPAVRRAVEEAYRAGGTAGLRERLRESSPAHLEALADPDNPRRLMRALELAWSGRPAPRRWRAADRPWVAGLRVGREGLVRRIRARVERMYADGLVDEVRGLMDRYPRLSRTAGSAIGYAEAMAVCRGDCTIEEAMRRTEVRTRRLAKRQMTWFLHQFQVEWVDVEPTGSLEAAADAVRTRWRERGPTEVHDLQAG